MAVYVELYLRRHEMTVLERRLLWLASVNKCCTRYFIDSATLKVVGQPDGVSEFVSQVFLLKERIRNDKEQVESVIEMREAMFRVVPKTSPQPLDPRFRHLSVLKLLCEK